LKLGFYVKKKIIGGRLLAFGGGNFAVFDDVRFQVLIGVNLEINATDDTAVFAFFIRETPHDRHAFKEFFLNFAIRIAEYCCFHIISILPHADAKPLLFANVCANFLSICLFEEIKSGER